MVLLLASWSLVPSVAGDDPPRETLVRIIVATPDAPVDQPDSIYCATNVDGWTPDARALRRVGDALYEGAWRVPAGTELEYKFVRTPSWDAVEKAADGGELPNRMLAADPDVGERIVLHVVARWADRSPAPGRSVALSGAPVMPRRIAASTLTGDVRFHPGVKSAHFGNERTIAVYLPPGYDSSPEQRFPVLYLHDGNNVFDAATSFAGVEWGADETAERLIRAGEIPPVILVGIANTSRRMFEYTPWPDDKHGGGEGDAYLDFVVGTVKPMIDATYHTKPDRVHTGIAGSSLGGLISAYAVLTRPDTFGFGAALSPSVWWGDRAILKLVGSADVSPRGRLWVDMGGREGRALRPGDDESLEDFRAFVAALRSRGFEEGVNLKSLEVADGQHNEAAWAARFDQVLRFLFPVSGGGRSGL